MDMRSALGWVCDGARVCVTDVGARVCDEAALRSLTPRSRSSCYCMHGIGWGVIPIFPQCATTRHGGSLGNVPNVCAFHVRVKVSMSDGSTTDVTVGLTGGGMG